MGKRDRIARTAAVSNGMVWFGLALFVGAVTVELSPAAFAGDWSNIVGWALLVLASLALAFVGFLEQRTMREARMKSRPAP
ncbi:hypothetical protein ACPW96_18225 [Micromonospora sp. DT81.3]|uniref:hypothetical protein n=1 Tax=Micromonospora sp. DT81.3 TaxID=3416523 RepID=UPI003CF8C607